MRLINSKTKELVEFSGPSIPVYAILSHTWTEGEEVSFRDMQLTQAHPKESGDASADSIRSRSGFRKIERCCNQALRNGQEWVWVDTCCIDKSSSAELSEAINSMFQWYKQSAVCYAVLTDVSEVPGGSENFNESLRKSRWFQRGWTLQELLAPTDLQMFNASWQPIGKLGSDIAFSDTISSITGIPRAYLLGQDLRYASISQRMSWAAWRETTRKEDMAYCLLGIFDVHMALLYGEGDKAFTRLQEEIIKNYDDHTILAWGNFVDETEPAPSYIDSVGILARSPRDFAHSGTLLPRREIIPNGDSPFEMTNKGLRIDLYFNLKGLAMLECYDRNNPAKSLYLRVVNSKDLSTPFAIYSPPLDGSLLSRQGRSIVAITNPFSIKEYTPLSSYRPGRRTLLGYMKLFIEFKSFRRGVYLNRHNTPHVVPSVSITFPPGFDWNIGGSDGWQNDLTMGPNSITFIGPRTTTMTGRQSAYIYVKSSPGSSEKGHEHAFLLMLSLHWLGSKAPQVTCKLALASDSRPVSWPGGRIRQPTRSRGKDAIVVNGQVITTRVIRSVPETLVFLLVSGEGHTQDSWPFHFLRLSPYDTVFMWRLVDTFGPIFFLVWSLLRLLGVQNDAFLFIALVSMFKGNVSSLNSFTLRIGIRAFVVACLFASSLKHVINCS
ncbi:hypothetical protein JX265_007042 [Neoarthrinium moseri]|uniref:Heterokaryon incompatibility domain-containing protein n=1 Tax=Neoarthrinium moseri TaxID=1658444 RepID=A0A9P9WKC2_9PEZI|nr:hypothetical protein JX265_007042 [Neoarthrinium moseri]